MSVKLVNLSKRFGPVRAVDSLSLEAEEGEFLAVVGPSGCGKTTLLRIIAGLESPDTGSVMVQGREVTHLPPEKRGVSIVFQNYALFPHMNVGENVAYGLRRQKAPRPERERRGSELLEMVGLASLRERRPHELSAGQQQRVALARALAPRPKTLLLDEPLSALDASLRERLRSEIRRMQRHLGITTILVTHDQEEALSTADRVAVMRQGVIEQVGDPWRLYDQPLTPFVAQFVGRANRFWGHVGGAGADLGPAGTVPRDALPLALPTGPVLALIRPESVVVSGMQGAAPLHRQGLRLQTVVSDVAFRGELCTVYLGWQGRTLIATAAGKDFSRIRVGLGQRCDVVVPYEDLRWVRGPRE